MTAVISGEGRDPRALQQAIEGHDAVIGIISASSRNDPHQAAEVAENLTTLMTREHVRRLVIASAHPIVAIIPRLPIAVLKIVFAKAYADLRVMETIVSASDLDCIARLNRLTDAPARDTARISQDLLTRPCLTRADVATALLQILESSPRPAAPSTPPARELPPALAECALLL